MKAALVTEYRKLVTTRLWWVLLLCFAAYMVFLGAMMAFVMTDPAQQGGMSGGLGGDAPPPMDAKTVARTVYTLAPSLGYVFPAIVGALSVTTEFRHKTLTPTFLAEPRRTTVLGAKLLASLPVGLLFGIVGTVSTVIGGAAVLAIKGEPTFLADASVLRSLGLCILVLAVWCMLGVGFGTALPNQVAAIVVLLAFTQFVEPLLRILLALSDTTAGIAKFLPGAAGEAATGGSFYASSGLGDLLPWGVGLAVLVAYGVGLSLLGRATTIARDVT